jgi:hypothetical protein
MYCSVFHLINIEFETEPTGVVVVISAYRCIVICILSVASRELTSGFYVRNKKNEAVDCYVHDNIMPLLGLN